MPWYCYGNDNDERKIINIQVTDRPPLGSPAFAVWVEEPDRATAITKAIEMMYEHLDDGYTVHIHIKPNPEAKP
jgi:hypothetical protein